MSRYTTMGVIIVATALLNSMENIIDNYSIQNEPLKPKSKQEKAACEECGRILSTWHHLVRHKQTVHEKLKFICQEKTCGQEFNRKDHCVKHMKDSKHLNPVFCSVRNCRLQFYFPADLEEHCQRRHAQKKYCEICKAQFTGYKAIDSLRRHLKKHQVPAYTCDTCGESYYRSDAFKKHHNMCMKFVCITCNQSFRNANNFTDHLIAESQKAAEMLGFVNESQNAVDGFSMSSELEL